MKCSGKHKRSFFISILLAFAGCLCLSGCIRTEQPDYSDLAPAEENRLVIYTSHQEEIYTPIIREFEKRTGIWVQVETGGSIELLERIASESEKPRCDLIFGGGVESLDSFSNRFSPYKSPEAENLPSKYIQKDGLWTPFSVLPVVLVYNPKVVRTNPPTGWDSLLDPAWRGKIAFVNPETSGSSYTALATLLQILPGEKEHLLCDFFDNLEGRTVKGVDQVVEEVANGSCYIGVTLEEVALRGINKGLRHRHGLPGRGHQRDPGRDGGYRRLRPRGERQTVCGFCPQRGRADLSLTLLQSAGRAARRARGGVHHQ